jgi:hypothetical protein
MSEITCINLTYKSPEEDIGNSIGFNPDGSVNVKYTLLSLRELLTQNLSVINKLIEKTDNISDIIPIAYGMVGIKINSPTVLKNLLDNNILIEHVENTEEPIIDELNFSEEEETNQERLNMINNLTNQNDSQIIFNKDIESDTDTDSETDDILDDGPNTKSILDKYIGVINDQDSDEDNISNSDEEIN